MRRVRLHEILKRKDRAMKKRIILERNITRLYVCILISLNSITSFASFSSEDNKTPSKTRSFDHARAGKTSATRTSPRLKKQKSPVKTIFSEESFSPVPQKTHNKQLLTYAYAGDKQKVGELLIAKADINAQDSDGTMALHKATLDGRTDVVSLLLSAGADKNIRDENDFTPLYIAAYQGHTDLVALLLDVGAQPNVQDKDGFTPLYAATWRGVKPLLVRIFFSARALSKRSTLPT